jgi:protein O-GlcNAc transferase
MRARALGAFDQFVDARSWTAAQLAGRIRDDEIDILVDLKGHTADAPSAVAALRPARVQVSYLGYPGTTGAPWIDYLMGDAIVSPEEHAAAYSEAVVQLPHSYQINDRMRSIPAKRERKADDPPEGAFVFCCFNDPYKINRVVFDAWAEILHAVPNAVLWLLSRRGQEVVQERLRIEAQLRGLSPERLLFASQRDYDQYLELYLYADVFLDTWPYNGHTTASDALWAGCPVLSLRCETFAGRVGASLLGTVGLPELIVHSVGSYVALAVDLAQDFTRVKRMRAYLEGPGRGSPLFDTEASTKAIEAAYRQMMLQSERGRREGFRVTRPEEGNL